MISRRLAIAAFSLALAAPQVFAPASFAKPAPFVPLSAEDQALADKAIAYLQATKSAKGHFTQTDSHGNVTPGTFFLQRPGKARFDYDPPARVIMASDGQVVSVWNLRLKTFQSYPLGMTPLGIFLAKEIRLDRGVKVVRVDRLADGFTVVARDTRHQSEGQIALTFTDTPLRLAGWTVTDAQGLSTRVTLNDFALTAPFDTSFFKPANPYAKPISR
ncbi:MAG TPA: outer-membrane lipoprotein carrier protein LolA [Caulobacteraceae bacterium]